MKENNNIDNFFKEGVKQEFPFDENLWAQVEGQLPVTPTRRSFWQFNLNSIILGVMLVMYASIQSDTAKSSKIYAQTKAITTSSEAIAQVVNPAEENTELDKELDAQTASTTEETQASAVKVGTTISSQKSASNVNNNSNTEENYTPLTSTSEINKTETPVPAEQTAEEFQQNKEETEEASSPLFSAVTTPSTEENKFESTIVPDESLLASNSLLIPSNSLKTTGFEKLSISSNETLPFSLLEPAGFNFESPLIASPKKKDNPRKILPKKRQYYLEFVGTRSIGLSKSISSTNAQFVNVKKRSETSLHMNNFGVNALTHYKFLTFGVGLHLSRFYENVNYNVSKETNTIDITYDTNFVIVDRNFDSNGNAVILIEEEITEIQTPRTIIVNDQLRVQNEFKRIRIPLSIGYEKAIGSWSAGLSTSFVINYLYQQNGVYINEDLNSINNFNKEEEFYLLVFGHQAAANIGYSLNEFVAIGARYNYEYDLNSFTRDYSSKFQSQNLGIWLRFRPK